MGVKEGEPGSVALEKANWFLQRLIKLIEESGPYLMADRKSDK